MIKFLRKIRQKMLTEKQRLGTEIPATERLFLRFDYTYTDYNSYSITTSHTNPDIVDFDNRESLFRVGGGIRF